MTKIQKITVVITTQEKEDRIYLLRVKMQHLILRTLQPAAKVYGIRQKKRSPRLVNLHYQTKTLQSPTEIRT